MSLLQEEVRDEPWKVLVACIMLNQTNFKQVRSVIWEFFERYPSARSLADADTDELVDMIRPLGFQNRRARTLKRFAAEFVNGNWERPEELHGIGKYGADSWDMFVLGLVDETKPTDRELLVYKDWFDGRK